MSKEIKTISGWCEFYEQIGKGSWYDYAEVGSVVDETVADSFMNALPPRSLSHGYLQMGEAYSHAEDENGNFRATYMTFAKLNGQWTYCGNCYVGETIDRS